MKSTSLLLLGLTLSTPLLNPAYGQGKQLELSSIKPEIHFQATGSLELALYGVNQRRHDLQTRIVELRKELNDLVYWVDEYPNALESRVKRLKMKAIQSSISEYETLLGKLELERKEILRLIDLAQQRKSKPGR